MTLLVNIHVLIRWLLIAIALLGIFGGSRQTLKRPLSIAWTAILDVQWLLGVALMGMISSRGGEVQPHSVIHAVIMTLAVLSAHILSRKTKKSGNTLPLYLVPGLLLAAGHLAFL